MRRLASELGVEAMSLYNHVTNKQDILDGMAGLLISRMRPWNDDPLDWKQALRAVCITYRATIAAHPHVFAGHGGRPLVAGEDGGAYESLIAMLRDAGFDEDTATDLFQAGSKLTRGFAMSDIATPADPTPKTAWDPDRAFGRALTVLLNVYRIAAIVGSAHTRNPPASVVSAVAAGISSRNAWSAGGRRSRNLRSSPTGSTSQIVQRGASPSESNGPMSNMPAPAPLTFVDPSWRAIVVAPSVL